MTRVATPPTAGADLVAQLFAAAFHAARDPRSTEYKMGTRAALAFRANGEPILRPYLPGTAQADAFWAGVDEGHAVWRAYQRAKVSGGALANASTADGA